MRDAFFLSVFQRDAARVNADGAGENHNSFYKSPNTGNHGAEPAGADCNQKLGYGFSRVAKVKVVNPKAAQKNPKEPRGHFGLLVRVKRLLLVWGLLISGRLLVRLLRLLIGRLLVWRGCCCGCGCCGASSAEAE